MTWLLNFIYCLFLLIASPVIIWRMVVYGKYCQGFGEKLLGLAPRLRDKKPKNDSASIDSWSGKRVWFHAVSVGEMNLLKPILRHWLAMNPHLDFVISTTSKTGMELGRKLFPDQTVFYCPLDFSWSVSNAIKRIQPDVLVLVELELWPNLINIAHRRGIKVAIINGRISDGSFRNYRRIRPFVRSVLKKVDLIAAQDSLAADAFRGLGAENVIESGAVKFDGVETDRNNPKTVSLATLAGFQPDDMIFLAGSTQEPEEEMALTTYRALKPDWPRLRMILVPRHPERFESVAQMLDRSGERWTRRSKISDDSAQTAVNRGTEDILLVDTIGELGAWWGTAAIAFVGGSMGKRGGQNMLEPAAFGAAVSFGPNTRNFRDISSRMIRENAAVVVHNQAEMTDFVRRVLSDPDWSKELGERARSLVQRQVGAAQKTIDLIIVHC